MPATRPAHRRILTRFGLFLGLIVSAGCGYNIGAPFSPEIRSVHVPIFNSGSNRRFLEYQLTEAVQKQIQQRSHFRLVKESEADTRLTGRVINLGKTALGQTRNSDARELQVNLQVEVTWEDMRTGKILQQQRVALPPELLQLASQAEFAPEIGQSLATADQTAIDRLARNIVDMMEVPW
jgi:lipopolysaccharide assembly LptE-like protein